jgi:calcium-dependent protein kinase
VRKCVNKETMALRAVKIVNKSRLSVVQMAKLMNEMSVMKYVDHANILKLYEFFEDHKRFFLVTELSTGKDLYERIQDQEYFSEKDAANYTK